MQEKVKEKEAKKQEKKEEKQENDKKEKKNQKQKTERQEKYPAHILYFAAKYNYFSTTIFQKFKNCQNLPPYDPNDL